MALQFIDVIDLTTEKNNKNHRQVTLSFSDKTYTDRLCLLGGLSHNTNITFDKKNAQKLVDFLQDNIINK